MKLVSPLVATAILLIITVAGGIIIYNYVVNMLSSPQQYASLNIVSSKMVVMDNGTILNVKIANIGTAKTVVDEITILPLNMSLKTNIVVEPGTTKSVNIEIGRQIDPSGKYYVVVKYGGEETEPYQVVIVK